MAEECQKQRCRQGRLSVGFALALGLSPLPARAADIVTTEYMQQFEQQGQQVFVMEYLDAEGRAVLTRRIEPLTSFDLTSTMERRYNQTHVPILRHCPLPQRNDSIWRLKCRLPDNVR